MYQKSRNLYQMNEKEEEHKIKQKFVQLPYTNIYGEKELRCPHCGRICVKSEHDVFSEADGVGQYFSVTRYECRYDLLDHTYRMSVPNPQRNH